MYFIFGYLEFGIDHFSFTYDDKDMMITHVILYRMYIVCIKLCEYFQYADENYVYYTT